VTDGLLAETDIDLFLVIAGDRLSEAMLQPQKKPCREGPGFEFS
jgi:hypothetical protein